MGAGWRSMDSVIAAASSRAATEAPGCACAPVATCLGSSLNCPRHVVAHLPGAFFGSGMEACLGVIADPQHAEASK